MTYKGYIIQAARPTGGKAGKGHNKTSTVQVMSKLSNGGTVIEKSVRYDVNDGQAFEKAMTKARTWIDQQRENGSV